MADTNNDGVVDTFGYDTNQNGAIYAAAVDVNQDGVADRVVVDRNEDGLDDRFGPSPELGVVGDAPTRDGAIGLVIGLSSITNDAVWAANDSDGDNITDSQDPAPTDPGQ